MQRDRRNYHASISLRTIEAIYQVVPSDRAATNLEIADRTRWSVLTVSAALRVLEARQRLVSPGKGPNGRKLWRRAA